jgi:hypothetical protein
MPYTRPYASGFVDYPLTTTPINSTALNTIDVGVKTVSDTVDAFTAAWTAYTPALTNTTAPITVARYEQIGKTVHFYVVLTLTGAQVTGLIGIALPPVAMLSTSSGNFDVKLIDSGVVYAGVGVAGATSRVDCYALNAAGTYAVVAATTSLIPFTWGAADQIIVSGTYESV